MRRIFSIILCVIFVSFPLVSCKNTANAQVQGYDDIGNIPGDYIFNSVKLRDGQYHGEDVLYKYNVKTGEWSTVCRDPFCDHLDEKCMFWNYALFTYIGNTIYIPKNDEEKGEYGIYAYNVETDEGGFIYHSKSMVMMPLVSYKYDLFFCETDNRRAIRFDTKTNTAHRMAEGYAANIFKARNGELIWARGSFFSTDKFYTDLDGNYLREWDHEAYFGKYWYKQMKREGYYMALDMYVSEDGENWDLLIENIGPATTYQDKIIYFSASPYTLDERTKIRTSDNGDVSICAPTQLWMCDPDGSNKTLLVDGVKLYMMAPQQNNPMVCGDYIAASLYPDPPIKDNEENINTAHLLIVNIKTGKYTITNPGI